jgi:heme oxygenase
MCTFLVVLFGKLYVLEGMNSLGARYIFMIRPWNKVTLLII